MTSALKRARAAVPASERSAQPTPATPSPVEVTAGRSVGDRFAEAIEAGDVQAMLRLLTDDAWLTMPPAPLAYQGQAAIGNFMFVVAFRSGNRRIRARPTAGANGGQPSYGTYVVDGDQTRWRPHGLLVLTVAGDRVAAMTQFVEPDLFPYFGLPATLD